MRRKHWLMILFIGATINACTKGSESPEPVFGFVKPSHFPEPVYNFSNNTVTREGFELGRKLFYDPILSRDNTISCASCHIQTAGFTHHGHSVSHGIDNLIGTRNGPAVMNLAWRTSFMWDGGVADLDLQPIAPITSHVEMDETVENDLNKLRNHLEYPSLFKKAFGTDEISSVHFFKALSQFMVMCISSNSKYDSVIRKQSSFTPEEEHGYQLFQQKCSSCHKEPLFTDNTFRNNGIFRTSVNDLGRYLITLNEADKYKFKIPSLRNLAYTPPYMHHGTVFTLEDVLNHYAGFPQNTLNLDPLLQSGIEMTEDEKTKIITFLNTLNDKTFVTDRRFSEP